MGLEIASKIGSAHGQDSSRAPGVSAAMALTMESRITLNDGAKIPVLGLGMWQAGAGKETWKAVSAALESGYRLIATAKRYGNERDVGADVRESGIPRDAILATMTPW